MNYKTIKIRDFFTPTYMTSFLSKIYRISDDQTAIIKKDKVMLFDFEQMEKYTDNNDYAQVELFGVDAEEYSEFRNLNIPHSKKKKPMVVSKISEEITHLESNNFKKIRNAATKYTE